MAKSEAKTIVQEANFKDYGELYRKLGMNDGEKNIYKLVKIREIKTRDLNRVKCTKDEDQRELVEE